MDRQPSPRAGLHPREEGQAPGHQAIKLPRGPRQYPVHRLSLTAGVAGTLAKMAVCNVLRIEPPECGDSWLSAGLGSTVVARVRDDGLQLAG